MYQTWHLDEAVELVNDTIESVAEGGDKAYNKYCFWEFDRQLSTAFRRHDLTLVRVACEWYRESHANDAGLDKAKLEEWINGQGRGEEKNSQDIDGAPLGKVDCQKNEALKALFEK